MARDSLFCFGFFVLCYCCQSAFGVLQRFGLMALKIAGFAVVVLLSSPFFFTLPVFVVRSRRVTCLLLALSFSTIIGWWLTLTPSNHRNWLPDVARTATATLHGDQIVINNVRNFTYRSETDYTETWEKRTYDLAQLQGFDMFISFWGPTLIAHTIASWEFADGKHLAISIETRKEKGEDYSAIRGFFRQYELYYVVADERDVIKLRTNFRGERVYCYRVQMPLHIARQLLVDYISEINRLAERPRWYNAFTHNCTTAIRYHFKNLGLAQSLDWRVYANGYFDELLYQRGALNKSIPFQELKKNSDITERARAAGASDDFSKLIRR